MGTTRHTHTTTRFRKMARGTSVHDVADRCREAVTDFLAGVATARWTAIDVELWLGAPYCSVTSALGATRSSSRTTFATTEHHSSSLLIEATLLEAGESVVEMLASCAHGPQPEFVTEAIERGLVAGVTDDNTALGYVPVDIGDMELVDRLASLIAADYLTRPNDYRSLTRCADCGSISFGWAPCDHGVEHEPYESGVVLRGGPSSSFVASLRGRAL